MTITEARSDADTTLVNEALDAFLAEHDPTTMDDIAFRGARYDAGLAWVHFPKGYGGLGVRPELNKTVETRLKPFRDRKVRSRSLGNRLPLDSASEVLFQTSRPGRRCTRAEPVVAKRTGRDGAFASPARRARPAQRVAAASGDGLVRS